MSSIASLQHGTEAIEGIAVGVSRPATANSNVEDDEEIAVGHRVPDILVTDARASDDLVTPAIKEPSDGLLGPVRVPAVNLDAPSMPALVRHADRRADAVALVADTAGVLVAVHGSVACKLAVDDLHDVEFAAGRPACAVADGVAEHPEGRPDALLVLGGVAAEAEGRLDTGDLAVGRGEGVLGLDAARGPVVVVLPRHELERVAARELHVARVALVRLELVVDVELGVDDVPVVLVGQRRALARKVVLPDAVPTAVRGRVKGRGDGGEAEHRGDEAVGNHACWLTDKKTRRTCKW